MGGTEVRWREDMEVGPRRTNKGNSKRENWNEREEVLKGQASTNRSSQLSAGKISV